MNVSRSGYDKHKKAATKREQRQQEIQEGIELVKHFKNNGFRDAGYKAITAAINRKFRKIQAKLKKNPDCDPYQDDPLAPRRKYTEHEVKLYCKVGNLFSRKRRQTYHHVVAKKHQKEYRKDNLVLRDFDPEIPYLYLLADITRVVCTGWWMWY